MADLIRIKKTRDYLKESEIILDELPPTERFTKYERLMATIEIAKLMALCSGGDDGKQRA